MTTCFYGSPSTAGILGGLLPSKSTATRNHAWVVDTTTINPPLLSTSAASWLHVGMIRRADSEDFAIRHHCGESTNSGFTWSDADINAQPFAPTHGNDIFVNPIYMGDYDVLTSDFLNHNSGFIGSFQVMNNDRGNPDVVAHPMN
jgi:hypothetical protein